VKSAVSALLVLLTLALLPACDEPITPWSTPDADLSPIPDAAPPLDAPATPDSYRTDEVLETDLVRLLRLITGEDPVEPGVYLTERFSDEARQRTAALMAAELTTAGYTVELQEFDFGLIGWNVVARLPATVEPPVGRIIVGGHYDTVSGVPGADDNGTGTVAVVAVGKRWAQLPERHHELWVVLFDLEEACLYGSEALAQALGDAQEDPELMINVDMIGWDQDREGELMVFDAWPEAQARVATIAATHRVQVTQLESGYSSDHSSFMMRGWPVLWLFEPVISPRWHRVTDTIDRLHVDYLTHVALWLEDLVTAIVTSPERWPAD
jgi:hypothetical protein